MATAHALATIGVGLVCALTRPVGHVAIVAAYIVGAEALWRMTEAGVFWEVGKYAIGAILLVAIQRRSIWPRWPPVLYFLLLLPGAFATVGEVGLREARQQISFNLSGPFCLAVCAMFFSGIALAWRQLLGVLAALIAPVVGIASVALFSTVKAETITFTASSNLLTSGGFGPNQVSAVLGLGVLVAFLLALDRSANARLRWALLGIALWLLGQSAITFSRSGLYLAAGSIGLSAICSLREKRSGLRVLRMTSLLAGCLLLLLWPRLDQFTEGALSTRFKDTRPTGRDEIAMADFRIWAENPLLGAGLGQAKAERRKLISRGASAHTEFTRLLAEHGLLGMLAIGLLLKLAVSSFRRARGFEQRAVVAGAIAWSFLFMLVNGMRLAAPAFMFGLACCTLLSTPASQAGLLIGTSGDHCRRA
jgi:hypothetical protein